MIRRSHGAIVMVALTMGLFCAPSLKGEPSPGFESFGAPGTSSANGSFDLSALPGLPGSDEGTPSANSPTTPSTDPVLQPTGFNPGTGVDPNTRFDASSGFGSSSPSNFGSGFGGDFASPFDRGSGSSDGQFDGIRKSDTATEKSRAAEFIRAQMISVFQRTTDKSVFKRNYHSQNIVSLGLIPDDDEGKLFFLGIMNDILLGAADRENEATLLDLRNQLFLIGAHNPVAGKLDGYMDANDFTRPDLNTLDRTVEYLDELIDKEQERKERLAEKDAERKARKAAANNDDGGGGGSGAGSSTPPSPLNLPPVAPGQPPQPIKQPQHIPDPSFVDNMNRYLQEAARSASELSGLFPTKQDVLVETVGNILKTIPTPPTKLTPPVDAVGILALQQRELAGLMNSAVAPLPNLFPPATGTSFLSRVQAFAQGNFSRLSVTSLSTSRANTPGRYPSSPVGAASLSGQSLFGRTGIAGPRLGVIPNFQELFTLRTPQRTPAGTTLPSSPSATPISRRRSVSRPLSTH
ncbi:MAG: hypothetical protein KDD51_04720 [Bdellovibrionales bacterium]|nr:hypothetical protein [Bdellovibrionales bacterium]